MLATFGVDSGFGDGGDAGGPSDGGDISGLSNAGDLVGLTDGGDIGGLSVVTLVDLAMLVTLVTLVMLVTFMALVMLVTLEMLVTSVVLVKLMMLATMMTTCSRWMPRSATRCWRQRCLPTFSQTLPSWPPASSLTYSSSHPMRARESSQGNHAGASIRVSPISGFLHLYRSA